MQLAAIHIITIIAGQSCNDDGPDSPVVAERAA